MEADHYQLVYTCKVGAVGGTRCCLVSCRCRVLAEMWKYPSDQGWGEVFTKGLGGNEAVYEGQGLLGGGLDYKETGV